MEQYDYKQDIINSRTGGIGGSEATMLATIANLGYVPKTAYKRMAICNGLIPMEDHGTNIYMRTGDYIENAIFEYLSFNNKGYQSNPLWVSEKFSKPNVRLLCHPDIARVDEKKQTIFVYECKTTRFSVHDTRITYRAQLYIEWLLAKEQAAKLGKKWKVKLFLVHYDTYGLNLEEGIEFDPIRLSVHEIRFRTPIFDVMKAMDITDKFLQTFDTYYPGDEVNADYLPEKVQSQFNQVAKFLREIKERENKVDEFKAKLYDFMAEKGIKRVSCDDFAFTLVAPTESVTTDFKKLFAEEIESKHPRTATKLKEKYKKVTKKKGFVMIKVNESNNN